MRKGYVYTTLAVVMAVCISACGGLSKAGESAEVQDNTATKQAEADTVTTAAEENPNEDKASENAAKEDKAYRITIEHIDVNYDIHPENGKTVNLCKTGYDTFSVENDSGNLAKILDAYSEDAKKRTERFVTDNGQDMYNAYTSDRFVLNCYDDCKVTFDRADSDVISFVENEQAYMGGVHGSTVYTGHTYDLKTGKEITIDDLVNDPELLADAVDDAIHSEESFADIADYYDTYSDDTYSEYLKEWYINGDEGFSIPWTMDNEGLHIWFSDYMLGAYAFGARDIKITYKDHPEVFKEGAYYDKSVISDTLDERVISGNENSETVDMDDFYYKESGYLLGDFTSFEGVYFSQDGAMLEIGEMGDYTYYAKGYSEDGATSHGFLRMNPGGLDMFEYAGENDEIKEYGNIALIEADSMDVSTPEGSSRFYYSEEQSNFMKYGGAGE